MLADALPAAYHLFHRLINRSVVDGNRRVLQINDLGH